jgi:hypothetical protein
MRRYLAILFGVAVILAVVLPTLLVRTVRTDLFICMNAARRLVAGLPVYRLMDFPTEHTKPPFATLAFAAFAWIPDGVMARLWDALNIFVFVAIAWKLLTELGAKRAASLCVGVLFVLLNPWNDELRMGQYNLLGLALCVWGALSVPSFFGGAFAVAVLMLKPSNVFFLPWMLCVCRSKRDFAIGGAVFVAGAAALYAALFGPAALVQDHLTWLAFLKSCAGLHAGGAAHDSLPAQLGVRGLTFALWPVAFAAIVLVSRRSASWVPGLAVAGISSVMLSPLGFHHYYVLLLPYVVILLVEERWAALVALASGLALANPEVEKILGYMPALYFWGTWASLVAYLAPRTPDEYRSPLRAQPPSRSN